jgi:hypothetical protein
MGRSRVGALRVSVAAFALVAGAGGVAVAAEPPRPTEEQLFGAPAAPPASDEPTKPGAGDAPDAPAPARPSEDDLFGTPPPGTKPAGAPGTPEAPTRTPAIPPPTPVPADRPDPLTIGGILYLRSFVAATEAATGPGDFTLSLPSIVDGYLDARPNDRVRGLVLGRLFFDASSSAGSSSAAASAGSGVTTSSGSNPRVVLDQLWVKFDVEHTVFVTAGRQHVKWGAARFWTPTDFLHSVQLNPLSVFDERTGTTMLKVHLPWESKGWNFYGVAAFDLDEPASNLRSVAGAARAEVVLGTVEIGADVLARNGSKPRIGVDGSAGLGPFDVYVESALTTREATRFRNEGPPCAVPLAERCAAVKDAYLSPATSFGLNWSYKYSDEDSVTLGAELFYNPSGYADASIYPLAAATGQLVPFYAGRLYAGAYVLLPKPGSWNNTTINLATLGNLSDRSFISRLDWQVLVLTYLQVQLFGAVHYGNRGGEFRFAVETSPFVQGGMPISGIQVAAPVFEAGLALKLAL